MNSSTQFLSFKCRSLPKVSTYVLAVFDNYTRKLVGNTDWITTANPDFEDMVMVKYFTQQKQVLHFNVYNVDDSVVRQKNFIGKAVLELDQLVKHEGRAIELKMWNKQNKKLDNKLKLKKAIIVATLLPQAMSKHIRISGWMSIYKHKGLENPKQQQEKPTRRFSSFPRANNNTSESSDPFKKKFVVITGDSIIISENIQNFFSTSYEHNIQLVGNELIQTCTLSPVDTHGHIAAFTIIEYPFEEEKTMSYHLDVIEELVKLSSPAKEMKETTSQVVYETPSCKDWYEIASLAKSDKIFNVPLEFAAQRSDWVDGLLPEPIRLATEFLNVYGLEEEGLYRIPGSKLQVEKYIRMFDRGEKVEFGEDASPSTIASLVVQFFSRCTDNLFTDSLAPTFKMVSNNGDDQSKQLKMLKKLLAKLPAVNYRTIITLIYHLRQISYYAEQNHMTGSKLAMCVYTDMARTVELLVNNYEYMFDETNE